MEKIMTLFKTKLRLTPMNLGLFAGFALILSYFINPYAIDIHTITAAGNPTIAHLIFAGEQLIIIATALTALALYFENSWLFGLNGMMLLLLWLIDCSQLLMHHPGVTLTISWILLPLAGLALMIAGSLVKDYSVIEEE